MLHAQCYSLAAPLALFSASHHQSHSLYAGHLHNAGLRDHLSIRLGLPGLALNFDVAFRGEPFVRNALAPR